MTTREDVSFLVGSDVRLTLMRALREEPGRPTELAERCSCARETAQRTLSGFQDRGWAEQRAARYRLTPGGEAVLDRYDDLETAVRNADRLRTFFAHAGDAVRDLPFGAVPSLEVTTATAEDPHAPVARFLSVFSDGPADSFRAITPIVSQVFNEAGEVMLGPDTDADLVTDESVLERSAEQYSEALELALEHEEFTLYVYPESVDFGMLILDEHVVVGAYDDTGNLVATVDGTDESFRAWAVETFERYRDASSVAKPDT